MCPINFTKIQNPAVTADKLQPTPDHMPNAALLASSSARPKTAALRENADEGRAQSWPLAVGRAARTGGAPGGRESG